jgi:PAN domain
MIVTTHFLTFIFTIIIFTLGAGDKISSIIAVARSEKVHYVESTQQLPSIDSHYPVGVGMTREYVTFTGVDIDSSSSLATYGFADVMHCISACTLDPRCNGVTKKPSGCYPRNSFNPSNNSAVLSFLKVQPRNGYIALINADLSESGPINKDLSMTTTKAPMSMGADCATACSVSSQCTGFILDYDSNPPTCWFKSVAAAVSVGVANKVYYLKAVPGYTTVIGLGINSGDDLAVYPNTSAPHCSSHCDLNAQCVGFAISASNECHLRSSYSAVSANYPSYVKANAIVGFSYHANVEYPGGVGGNVDIYMMRTNSWGADCATACRVNGGCVGFTVTYNISGFYCTLKSAMATSSFGVPSVVSYASTAASGAEDENEGEDERSIGHIPSLLNVEERIDAIALPLRSGRRLRSAISLQGQLGKNE